MDWFVDSMKSGPYTIQKGLELFWDVFYTTQYPVRYEEQGTSIYYDAKKRIKIASNIPIIEAKNIVEKYQFAHNLLRSAIGITNQPIMVSKNESLETIENLPQYFLPHIAECYTLKTSIDAVFNVWQKGKKMPCPIVADLRGKECPSFLLQAALIDGIPFLTNGVNDSIMLNALPDKWICLCMLYAHTNPGVNVTINKNHLLV